MVRIVFSVTLLLFFSGCAVNSTVAEAQDNVQPPPVGQVDDGLLFNILAAEISAQQGDHNAAFLYYQKATALSEIPAIAERSAKLSIHNRNGQQSIMATRRWVEKEPDSIDARRILGALLLRDHQQEAAVEQFQALITLKEESLLGGFQLVAEQLRKEPDTKAADAALATLVDHFATHAEAWYVQSWYYTKRKSSEQALTTIDHALKLRPDWGRAVVLRVSILETLGRAGEIVDFLREQAQQLPKDVEILQRYAKALLSQNRNSEAETQFKKALKLRPRSAEILSAVALLQLNSKKYEAARTHLLRLLELEGQSDKANYYLGELEEGLENDQKASDYYASVGHGILYLNARIRMATLAAKTNVDDGISILRGLSVHDERMRIQVLLLEGELLEEAKRYLDAVKIYDQALQLSPANEEILYARAMAGDLAGRLDILERDLHAILAKNSKHYHAWNALGYTLTLRTERYKEAKGYLRKALALRPNDFYVLDSMGWVLYKLKEKDQSLIYLGRALKAKQDAEVAAHLGEVRWVNGDRKGARSAWKLAKELDDKNPIVVDTLERFSQ